MELQPVRSDAITAVGYDVGNRVLAVLFTGGHVYEYQDVDVSLFEAILDSQPHPWSRLGGQVTSHPYRRIPDADHEIN